VVCFPAISFLAPRCLSARPALSEAFSASLSLCFARGTLHSPTVFRVPRVSGHLLAFIMPWGNNGLMDRENKTDKLPSL